MKSRQPTVLFVPGFDEHQQSRPYDVLLNELAAVGYDVRFVILDWQDTTQDDWVQQVQAVYENLDPAQTILAGFSFGAVTALLVAARRPPRELWLFSLSSLFAEWSETWSDREASQGRLAECRQMRLGDIVQRVTCPVRIFAGELELKKWPDMKGAFDCVSRLAKCRSFVVPGVGHAVETEAYVSTITANTPRP